MVLVLNCGSSSVKFQVIEVGRGTSDAGSAGVRRLARGIVERLGGPARARFEGEGRPPLEERVPAEGHGAAVRRIVAWLDQERLDVVGHRVVHGGTRFRESVLVDDEVLAGIEEVSGLAPLHNAPSLAGIRTARSLFGREVPMVAVFDTAFHATLPARASRYAIPYELSLRHGIRRFGFHGISFRSVVARYGAVTGRPAEGARLIVLHLGAGSSAAAVRDGASVDTSMGFTPLEGLVMATRSGDLDPSLVGFLARSEGISIEEVEEQLNERSGLLGVAGRSGDVRDLLARAGEGDARARLALDLFCYRARKYVGAYLAVLGGADGVVFTGGIGEHAPAIRAAICEGMAWCGLALDPARNAAAVGVAARISPGGAALPAYVIPTDEELVIARDAARVGGADGRSAR